MATKLNTDEESNPINFVELYSVLSNKYDHEIKSILTVIPIETKCETCGKDNCCLFKTDGCGCLSNPESAESTNVNLHAGSQVTFKLEFVHCLKWSIGQKLCANTILTLVCNINVNFDVNIPSNFLSSLLSLC